jgi:hypothetical protein
MHKEKVSGMSHKGFFFNQEQKKNIFFGNFSWMFFFLILQMSTYLMPFIDN